MSHAGEIDPRRGRSGAVWWIALLVLALGSVTSSLWLDERTVSVDETASIIGGTRSLGDLAELVRHVDLVHAAYYGVLHLWFDVVGYSPVTLRLVSALAAAAAAALMVPLGARLVNLRTGVVGAVLLLLLPVTVLSATNGRSMSLQMLAAVASTLLLIEMLRAATSRVSTLERLWMLSAAYVVVAALGITFQLWFVFVVLGHAAVSAWNVLVRQRSRPARILPVAVGFLALAAVAAVLGVAASTQSGQIAWIRSPTPSSVLLTLWRDEAFSLSLVERPSVVPEIAASVGFVLALVGAIRLVAARTLASPLLLTWWALPPVGILLISALQSPTFAARYLVFCVPAYALLMAAGLDTLWRASVRSTDRGGSRRAAPKWFGAVAMAVAGVVFLGAGAQAWSAVRWGDPTTQDWKTVAQTIARTHASTPQDRTAVLFGELGRSGVQLGIDYPAELQGIDDLTFGGVPVPPDSLWPAARDLDEAVALIQDHDVVWYVGSNGPSLKRAAAALHDVGLRGAGQTRFTGGFLVEFRRVAP